MLQIKDFYISDISDKFSSVVGIGVAGGIAPLCNGGTRRRYFHEEILHYKRVDELYNIILNDIVCGEYYINEVLIHKYILISFDIEYHPDMLIQLQDDCISFISGGNKYHMPYVEYDPGTVKYIIENYHRVKGYFN